MNQLSKIIKWVSYQLYINALLMCGLAAVSAFLLAFTFWGNVTGATIGGGIGLLIAAYLTGLFQNKRPEAIELIHRHIQDTEYSLQLLEIKQPNIAQQLQLERLVEKIQYQKTPRIWPSKGWIYVVIFLTSLGIFYGMPLLKKEKKLANKWQEEGQKIAQNKEIAPSFASSQLTITPLTYTQLPVRTTTDMNVSAISGSGLKWQLSFSHSTDLTVKLANNQGEELPFKKVGERFEYSDQLYNSGLYSFKAYWKDSLVYQSDYYRLEAIADLAPKIEPTSKELYQYHFLKDPKKLTISAKISDDFRVNQAFIVATVARGSGENVKFRELKLPIAQTNFKEATLIQNIDLKALNFTPGDELYYYWAAIDNKHPTPNFSKSDTYFVVYKDTAQVEEAELATMAMNILPEYFRSQRQIIIDTEKLLGKQKRIATKEFNSTSNEIGFDQKALRMRYGQYLGEEFEASIGGGNALPKDNEGDAVVGFALLHGFVHAHDQGEASGESGGGSHEGHNHGGDSQKTNAKDPVAAILEEYVHAHDDAEANTFYEQSTRSLLKMALEQMWQSELHLRLYEPEKAIPFEKKALEYLKLAQQRARTFVKKTSFDPPPIKEKEKRLTGELKNYNEAYRSEKVYSQQQAERLAAEVLGIVEVYKEGQKLTGFQKQKVLELSRYLTAHVMNSQLSNWSVLGYLQKVASNKPLSTTEKMALKTKLFQLVTHSLPDRNSTSNSSYANENKLEKAFWKNLQ